jgi:hypothetical protein
MRQRRGYALIGAGALLAVGIAAALLLGRDEPSRGALSTTTAPSRSTTPVTTEAVTAGTVTMSTGTGSTHPATSHPAPPRRPYALAPTRACLKDAGFAVSKVRSTNPRLRALGDLAQRTSLELRLDGQALGLAFANATLLADLLRVPDDPFRLEVHRNALLMYRPSARTQAHIVIDCLRS